MDRKPRTDIAAFENGGELDGSKYIVSKTKVFSLMFSISCLMLGLELHHKIRCPGRLVSLRNALGKFALDVQGIPASPIVRHWHECVHAQGQAVINSDIKHMR